MSNEGLLGNFRILQQLRDVEHERNCKLVLVSESGAAASSTLPEPAVARRKRARDDEQNHAASSTVLASSSSSRNSTGSELPQENAAAGSAAAGSSRPGLEAGSGGVAEDHDHDSDNDEVVAQQGRPDRARVRIKFINTNQEQGTAASSSADADAEVVISPTDEGSSASPPPSPSSTAAAVPSGDAEPLMHRSLRTINRLLRSNSQVVSDLREENARLKAAVAEALQKRDEATAAFVGLEELASMLQNDLMRVRERERRTKDELRRLVKVEADAKLLVAEVERLKPLEAKKLELEDMVSGMTAFLAGEAAPLLQHKSDDNLRDIAKGLQVSSMQIEAERTRRAEAAAAAAQEANTCPICMERQLTHFFDCGHRICEPCGARILGDKKQCHFCRDRITWVKKLY